MYFVDVVGKLILFWYHISSKASEQMQVGPHYIDIATPNIVNVKTWLPLWTGLEIFASEKGKYGPQKNRIF